MVQLIKPRQVQVSTQDGELLVHITLDLNLNLTGAVANIIAKEAVKTPEEVDRVEWQIPEFTSTKVKFGK